MDTESDENPFEIGTRGTYLAQPVLYIPQKSSLLTLSTRASKNEPVNCLADLEALL